MTSLFVLISRRYIDVLFYFFRVYRFNKMSKKTEDRILIKNLWIKKRRGAIDEWLGLLSFQIKYGVKQVLGRCKTFGVWVRLSWKRIFFQFKQPAWTEKTAENRRGHIEFDF